MNLFYEDCDRCNNYRKSLLGSMAERELHLITHEIHNLIEVLVLERKSE